MESKPPEKKAKPDNIKPPIKHRIDKLKEELEIVKTACMLGLLDLERHWNKNGTNDSHLYDDLRTEYVKS